MATNIILRSIKAAALIHAEMDQNWESLARTVETIVADKTIDVADQNKIFESDYPSGVVTLPTVTIAGTAHTDSYRVTIKNIHTTQMRVDAGIGESIEGNSSILLNENESINLSLSSDKTEWSIIGFYGQSLVGIVATPDEINTLQGYTGDVNDHNLISGGFAAGVTAAMFKFLAGVTSSIQSQINARLISSNNLSDLPNKATSRSNLGVDASGTDNSTNVTLAGTPNYITIAGQVITRGLVNMASHVTSILALGNGGTGSSTATGARNNLGLGALATLNEVSQGDLKSVTGQVLHSAGSWIIYTLPGGTYGFYPQFRAGDGQNSRWEAKLFPDIASNWVQGTTYITRIGMRLPLGSSPLYVQQRYIQASPPYDLNDGVIPLFIFALVSGNPIKIEGLYIAPEAPWHLNGKTNTAARYSRNNASYRMEKKGIAALLRNEMTEDDIIKIPSVREQFLLLNESTEELEITQAIKQRDMSDIPHPFIGNNLTGKTVIMLDPAHDEMWKLFELFEAGIKIGDCIYDNRIKISNDTLNRTVPNGVQAHSFKWK